MPEKKPQKNGELERIEEREKDLAQQIQDELRME